MHIQIILELSELCGQQWTAEAVFIFSHGLELFCQITANS